MGRHLFGAKGNRSVSGAVRLPARRVCDARAATVSPLRWKGLVGACAPPSLHRFCDGSGVSLLTVRFSGFLCLLHDTVSDSMTYAGLLRRGSGRLQPYYSPAFCRNIPQHFLSLGPIPTGKPQPHTPPGHNPPRIVIAAVVMPAGLEITGW